MVCFLLPATRTPDPIEYNDTMQVACSVLSPGTFHSRRGRQGENKEPVRVKQVARLDEVRILYLYYREKGEYRPSVGQSK